MLGLATFATTGALWTSGAEAASPTCAGRSATIVGTDGHDELHGTSGADVIVGRGGADDIEGRGGNDFICGNDGNDDLEGDAGNDHLYGGRGYDEAEGDAGNDVCRAEQTETC